MRCVYSATLAVLSAIALGGASADAADGTRSEGLYFGANAGIGFVDGQTLGHVNNVAVKVNYEDAAVFGVEAGYALSSGLRPLIEFNYMRMSGMQLSAGPYSVDFQGKTEAFSFLAGLAYDLDLGGPVTPYVGAALGITHIDAELDNVRFNNQSYAVGRGGDSSNFTWALDAGAMYRVSPTISVGPSYRYLNVQNGNRILDDDRGHLLRIKASVVF